MPSRVFAKILCLAIWFLILENTSRIANVRHQENKRGAKEYRVNNICNK